MEKYALIVAGGSGTRMGSDIPKQFLLLNGLPVLMQTIKAFAVFNDISIVVVLPKTQINHWEVLCKDFSFNINHQLVEGGDTRFHSVKNGLAKIPSESLVAIHDGVRPLISYSIINNAFETAEQYGSAITVIPLKDSIREQKLTGKSISVNRQNYYLVQTPQTFKSNLIKDAYENATHENFTDDAGVFEEAAHEVKLIQGEYKNIKITTPEDLAIASVLMKV